jgi:hypothetical protein
LDPRLPIKRLGPGARQEERAKRAQSILGMVPVTGLASAADIPDYSLPTLIHMHMLDPN